MPRLKRDRRRLKGLLEIYQGVMETREEIVPINSIKIWDKNPVQYVTDVISKLAKIIDVHGQITAVVVYTGDNMIRKGNKTYLAMKKNGSTHIRVKFVEFKSLAVANAYALADNLSSTWSQMDDDLVNKLLASKDFKGIDIDEIKMLTGYDSKDLDLLEAGGFAAKNYSEAKEDFEKTKGKLEKGKRFWFWFEVDDEDEFNEILKEYARTKEEGKRLHRELDPKKMVKALI